MEEAYGGEGRLTLATSGGGDSLAMMVLATRWGRERGVEMTSATVDYAMREGSWEEAEHAGRVSRGLGIEHVVLRRAGGGGGEAEMRRTRYEALSGLMERTGAGGLVLGHTREDQAETVLLRLAGGSGVEGLGCMSMRSRCGYGGGYLLRPLLETSREELRDLLRGEGLSWREDETNESEEYGRGRLRASRALLEREGLTVERLTRLTRRTSRATRVLEEATREARGRWVEEGADAWRLDEALLESRNEEVGVRLLRAALEGIGGGSVRLMCVEGMWDALRGEGKKRTLGGCEAWRSSGAIWVKREGGAGGGR